MTMLRALLCLLFLVQPLRAAVVRAPVRVPVTVGGAAGSVGAALGTLRTSAGAAGISGLGAPSLPSTALPVLRPVPTPAAGRVGAAAPSIAPSKDLAGPAPAVRGAAGRAVSASDGKIVLPGRGNSAAGTGKLPKKAFEAPAPSLSAPSPGLSASDLKAGAYEDWAGRMGVEAGPLNILMTGSESFPYIKTGGLADVIDDVSRGLAERGHHVTIVLPKYADISEAAHGMKPLPGAYAVPIGGEMKQVKLWRAERQGVEVLFVENEEYFGRSGAYGYDGHDYLDNDERFAFHARAALEAVRFLERKVDLVHVHDWQAGLIPAYLKLLYKNDPLFASARSVMTIHNIAYQGFFGKEALPKAGFSWEDYTPEKLEYWDHFSYLKAGIAFADAITTVSPTYSKQIQTGEEFGRGMQGLLAHRSKDVSGILNGVDESANDPRNNRHVAHHFSKADVNQGKKENKAVLQKKAGFAVDPKRPLFGIASRLADQKGIDLVLEIIPVLVKMGAQLFVIGSGEREIEKRLDALAHKYPKNIFRHGFDTKFVHQIYAGSDFLLMPSRFEPCGISQMLAHLYGTIPIASRTGGLVDTIRDITEDPHGGDGFFMPELSAQGLKEAVAAAMEHFEDKDALARSRKNAMERDHSWGRSLDEYEALYRKLLKPFQGL